MSEMNEEEWIVYRYTAEESGFQGMLDYESRADWDAWIEQHHKDKEANSYYELVATGLTYEQARQFVRLTEGD